MCVLLHKYPASAHKHDKAVLSGRHRDGGRQESGPCSHAEQVLAAEAGGS